MRKAYLTLVEIANRWDVSRPFVVYRIKKGALRSVQVGKRNIIVLRRELYRYEAAVGWKAGEPFPRKKGGPKKRKKASK